MKVSRGFEHGIEKYPVRSAFDVANARTGKAKVLRKPSLLPTSHVPRTLKPLSEGHLNTAAGCFVAHQPCVLSGALQLRG